MAFHMEWMLGRIRRTFDGEHHYVGEVKGNTDEHDPTTRLFTVTLRKDGKVTAAITELLDQELAQKIATAWALHGQ